MCRLICAFVVRIWHKTHFLMLQLIFILVSTNWIFAYQIYNQFLYWGNITTFTDRGISPAIVIHFADNLSGTRFKGQGHTGLIRQPIQDDWLSLTERCAAQIQAVWDMILNPVPVQKESEPRHEKTYLRGVRPGKTLTGLLSFRS